MRPVSSAIPKRASSGRVAECKLRVRGEKALDDRLVFVAQHAAGRVNQASTRLERRRGGREQARLLGRELGHRGLRLPPLEGGIAAQGAEAGAWRVDQHAIDLP